MSGGTLARMVSASRDQHSLGRPSETSAGRLFIVDDDPEIRKVLKNLLVGSGYRIEEFELGGPALERVRTDPPDLVLLDLKLPDRSGHDVLEEIRSDPATRLLPVVMLTAFGNVAEKIRAQKAGVTDFLDKPFAPEELVPRVRSLVMLKHFADEHEHAERVILTLAKMIDARDPHTAGHSGRVAEYADRIAQRMGLEPGARNEMRRGALFHIMSDEVKKEWWDAEVVEELRAVIAQSGPIGGDSALG